MKLTLHKLIVTGASGFVAAVLMSHLRAIGNSALGVSRRPVCGVQRLASYLECPAAEVIIHLAEDPHRGKVNAAGQFAMDQSASVVEALLGRCGRLIYASSSVVYGDTGTTPCTEEAPVRGSDIYSLSKLRNEKLVLDAGGIVIRLSNLFGPGMSPDNVLSDIQKQIHEAGALRVRDATPVRDFLDAREASAAIAALSSFDGAGIFNIGSGTGLSIRGAAQTALAAVGEESRSIVASASSGRLSFNVLDVSRARRELAWSPSPPNISLTRFFQHGAKT